jgi:hypothetical protein
MSFPFGKKTRTLIKSPGGFIIRWCARIVMLTVMLSPLLVATLQASTLLDPQPEHSSTLFGYSIAVVGDVDGDGVPDLAVGAPFQDGDFTGVPGFGKPQNVGKVFLISGRTLTVIRELNDPEFQMIQSQKFGGQFGFSVAAVGDVNGDGVPDILVGVPHHIVPEQGGQEKVINAGRAFVFSGNDGAVLLTLDDPTPQEGAKLGFAVTGLKDINSDGVPDLLVGAPGKDISDVEDSQVGIAYIFSGRDGSVIRSLNFPSPGQSDNGANFGAAVANAGRHEVIIGAPRRSRAFVFNAATGTLKFTIQSPITERQPSFGFAIAAGKDLNGDGTADFAIGAPLANNLHGLVFLFSGADASLQRTLRSPDPQAFARFGASIFLSEDISGDGRPDILVGAPEQKASGQLNAGKVFIFRGTGSQLRTVTSTTPQAFAGFGYAVATGDFNGDGIPEPVIGVPFQNADLIAPDGDVETHLQIGQIEIR